MMTSSSLLPATSTAHPSAARGTRARALLLVATAALALAGCDKLGIGGSSAPKGQVVATLDGQEITVLEVNAELAGTPIPPTMSRRDAEKLALENILTRRMLSKVAEERELHKRPEFLLQERRASEQLRVQSLARDIAAKVVVPTRDEADKFISENPYLFADRKFLILDQIQFLRPENVQKLGLEGAKTMPEVEQILTANKVPFRRQPASLDTLGANPAFVKEVTSVLSRNPEELFMFATRPEGAPAPVVLVNQVKETRVQPFTGDKAREYATNFLRNERIQNALRAEVERQEKMKKERVVFQPGWEPAKKKPGAAPKPGMNLPAPDTAAAPAAMGGAPAAPSAPVATPADAAVAPAAAPAN
jgi:EpsD family peptidyl-prolyl cis-trans isomerase